MGDLVSIKVVLRVRPMGSAVSEMAVACRPRLGYRLQLTAGIQTSEERQYGAIWP